VLTIKCTRDGSSGRTVLVSDQVAQAIAINLFAEFAGKREAIEVVTPTAAASIRLAHMGKAKGVTKLEDEGEQVLAASHMF
jgi:hypothetical protein